MNRPPVLPPDRGQRAVREEFHDPPFHCERLPQHYPPSASCPFLHSYAHDVCIVDEGFCPYRPHPYRD